MFETMECKIITHMCGFIVSQKIYTTTHTHIKHCLEITMNIMEIICKALC